MPWWATVYVIVLIMGAAASIVYDLTLRERWWYVLCKLLSACMLVALISAYWHPNLADILGMFAMPMLAAAFAWDIATIPTECRKALSLHEFGPDDDRWVKPAAVAAVILVMGPGYVIAALVCIR